MQQIRGLPKHRLLIRRLLKRLSHEQGSALVLTGIALAVLMGFTALAVDGGYVYFKHTKLQDVADASALAAASQLAGAFDSTTEKKAAAFNAALRCVERNGFLVGAVSGLGFEVRDGNELGYIWVSFPSGTAEVKVEFRLTAATFFAKAVSVDEAPLAVAATAEILGYDGASETDDLVPIAFFHGTYTVGEKMPMTLTPGNGVEGNYGFLTFGCCSYFRCHLEDGYSGSIRTGDAIQTYPGVSQGQVKQSLERRLAGCTSGCGTTPVNHIEESCPRVVVVPMVAGFQQTCGKSEVTVTGFVKFFIEGYDPCTKIITARFLGQAGPANFAGTELLAQRSARLK